ncbi:MAG: PPC domain-containing protein [Planctomycetes bacterium]|nr:PPC domain-containing protein [Planctomycetota bacterium]MBI3833159.1 PPC domain-containing protein [Planctomycetota bacterium]
MRKRKRGAIATLFIATIFSAIAGKAIHAATKPTSDSNRQVTQQREELLASINEQITDATSREASVFRPWPVSPITDAISREVSVFEESSESHISDAVSREVSTFSVIPLVLGTPYEGSLPPGSFLFFRVTTPPDLTLRIDLDHASETAWTELYASFGKTPDTFDAEFSSESPAEPDQELVIPNTQAGTYYILARATTDSDATASKSFRLLAQASLFALDWIKPTTVGAGVATLEFRGARFGTATAFSLVCPTNGTVLNPVATTLTDAAHARVTFDLTGVPLGNCDVRISEPDGRDAELAAGLQVDPPNVGRIQLSQNLPSALRGGGVFDMAIEIAYSGNVDLDIVVLTGRVPNDSHVAIWPTLLGEGASIHGTGLTKGFSLVSTAFTPGEKRLIPVSLLADTEFPAHATFSVGFVAIPYSTTAYRNGPLFRNSEKLRLAFLADPSAPSQLRSLAQDPDVWWETITNYFDRYGFSQLPSSVASIGDTIRTFVECFILCFPFEGIPKIGPIIHIVCHLVCAVIGDPEPTCIDESGCDHCIVNEPGDSTGDCVPVIQTLDPNEKVGPLGYGDFGFVKGSEPLNYRVAFENVAQATAPAAEIRITDQLDPSLDASSFRLRRVQFGDHRVDVPEGRGSIQTVVDALFEAGVLVEITGGVDAGQNNVSWTLRALDPETRQLPTDPTLGFLPPNVTAPEGEGFVEFTIKPKASVTTGTVITNTASIVFDYNDPIATNGVSNTIDAAPPQCAVQALPAVRATPFVVRWSAEDDAGGSGVALVDVFVETDGGGYERWISSVGHWSYFDGEVGKTYAFYAVGRDNVGNVGAVPATPDTTTAVTRHRQCGDVDYDEGADLTDHYLFAQCFEQTPNSTVGGPDLDVASGCAEADLNVDGRVDLKDFAQLQNGFGDLPNDSESAECAPK